MKTLFAAIALCGTMLAHAQAPAHHAAAVHPAARPAATHAASDPALLHPALLKAKAPADYKVKFTTTVGEILIEVHRDWAPLAADRFYNLVRHGYYNNAAFYRVVPGFVVQFGMNPNPAVNKLWADAKIQDDPVTQSNKRATITFAMAGPNTRTTQLFINYVDNARLDGMGFAPFGQVIQGMENVDKIFPGYGQRPDQEQMMDQGDKYITANFPEIDRIKTARIEPAAPAPAAHPAAKPATKPATKPAPPTK